MNLWFSKKIVFFSPLKKDLIKEILANSLNGSGPEGTAEFVSGFVEGDSFKIHARPKNVLNIRRFPLLAKGKMIEVENGCQVELIIKPFIIYEAFVFILFSAGFSISLFSLFRGIFEKNYGGDTFSFLVVVVVYLLMRGGFDTDTIPLINEFRYLLQANR